MKQRSHKDFIIDNLGYRIGIYHPGIDIQIGTGNTNANVVVVQPYAKMPERDAITGALKNFSMLHDAYRATASILGEHELNRYYLRELIQIIQPLVVVACGHEVMSILKKRKIRSKDEDSWFASRTGKKFIVSDIADCVLYATINPTEYGFARASKTLKAQGKEEWTNLASIYKKLKEKQEKERWKC